MTHSKSSTSSEDLIGNLLHKIHLNLAQAPVPIGIACAHESPSRRKSKHEKRDLTFAPDSAASGCCWPERSALNASSAPCSLFTASVQS